MMSHLPSTALQHAPGVLHRSLIDAYLRWCAAAGLTRQALLERAELAEEALGGDGVWVGQSVFERLFLASLAALDDPLLGLHRAQAMEVAEVGLLGFLGLSCPSILELFDTLQNYGRLLSNIPQCSLRHEPGRVLWLIEFSYHDERLQRHSREWMLASCARLIHRLDPHALLEVRLSHEAHRLGLQPHPDYALTFPCPLRFVAAESALVLAPERLKAISPQGHPRIFQTLRQEAQAQLHIDDDAADFLSQLRLCIGAALDRGVAAQGQLCAQLGISERQLHRRLQPYGLSYQKLLDEVRLQRLQALLKQPCTAQAMALSLGFASAKTFSRWLIAQTGLSLQALRYQCTEASSTVSSL